MYQKIFYWDINNDKQTVKTEFVYNKHLGFWSGYIVCGENKRQCNDCLHKTKLSPKSFFGKKTGKTNSNNMEIFLKSINRFCNLKQSYILRIKPINKYLFNKYSFLLDYGFYVSYNDKNIDGYYEKIKIK